MALSAEINPLAAKVVGTDTRKATAKNAEKLSDVIFDSAMSTKAKRIGALPWDLSICASGVRIARQAPGESNHV